MKHKRETDEREAMRAMANVIVRIELKRRVIELFGCLFTYSLDRTKQIDRYRSSEIRHNQNSISRSSSGGISGGISGGSISSGGGGSRSRSIIEEKELPWLIEIKNITFYFGRIEYYGKN